MPFAISPAARSALRANVHRLAVCWEIVRTDGVVHRFTSHNTRLTFNGQEYSPVGYLDASASVAEQQLKVANREVSGYITADAITESDLRAGRFRDAAVTEFTVNWRFPYLGAKTQSVYYIADTNFDGEQWKAQVEGLGYLLEQVIGGNLNRNCEYKYGDIKTCMKDLTGEQFNGTVSSIFISRRVFNTTLTNPRAYYNLGRVDWLTGDNAGLRVDVKAYAHGASGVNGRLYLWIPAAYRVQVGDTFTATRGCDGTETTCIARENIKNFGGHPDVPGTDYQLTTPDIK